MFSVFSCCKWSINLDALIRTVILLGFLVLFIWLTNTGQLALFINPRLFNLVSLAGHLIFALLLFQCTQLLKYSSSRKKHRVTWEYFPFIVTIIIAFAVPNGALDERAAEGKGFNQQLVYSDTVKPSARKLIDQVNDKAIPIEGTVRQIKINDENYLHMVAVIVNEPQKFVGSQIETVGFVLRDPTLPKSQIALVRYVIACCSADATIVGFVAEGDGVVNLKPGSWQKISGTLQVSNSKKQVNMPVIQVTTVESVAAPANPYIYSVLRR